MNQENNPYRPEEKAQGPFPYGQNNTPAPEQNPSAPTSPSANESGYTAAWSSRTAGNEQSAPQGTAQPPRPPHNPYDNASYRIERPYDIRPGANRVVLGQPAPEQTPSSPYSATEPNGYATSFEQPSYGGAYPPPPSYPPFTPPTPKQPKQPRYASRASVAVAILLAVVLSLGCGAGGMLIGMRLGKSGGGTASPVGSGSITIQHIDSDYKAELDLEGSIASVAEKVAPAVVEIYTDTVVYSQYFGQQVESGAGSGVIITKDGYIVTCAHVIDGADKITVRLRDGKEYEAKKVGSDSQTDIAVIKIERKEDLPFVAFASSENLVVGQPIVVVGNPLGSLGGSVTNGIISATNREIEIEGQLYNLLQTNAAINSGNSGGGMFDMNGNLVGVVNAKSSGTSIEGLGFAIPSSQAEQIATELMAHGFVKNRPTIGVSLLNVNSQEVIMRYLQYSRFFTEYGVYIMESEHDSMELGDRLVAIDGAEIDSMSDVQKCLADKKVGDTVEITIARLNGRKSELITVQVTLRERTAED